VNQLIDYLRKNLILDFQGDLNVEMCREFLKDDDSRDARQLLAKLVQDRSTSEMMLVLADCLLEVVQNSLTDDVMREQLRMYSES
jgi:thioredoxin-like negative regulator of GroEL